MGDYEFLCAHLWECLWDSQWRMGLSCNYPFVPLGAHRALCEGRLFSTSGSHGPWGGVPCAVHALCEKLAVLHHREFSKFRKLKGRH